MERETLPCKNLIKIAKLILDGEPIPLPFNKTKPLWKFKETVSKDKFKKNVMFEKNGKSMVEILKWHQYFNVSSRDVKARKIFITFGHNCCAYSKQRALFQAKTIGEFDFVHSFNFHAMTNKFRKIHNYVLKAQRGAGYWLWKPYIILKSLIEHMNEGDIVMYQDAGAYIIRSPAPLFKLCEKSKHGAVIFSLNKIEHEYTKQDAFVLMNITIPEASDTFQRLASYILFRKCCTTIQFVMEWLAYLSDRRIASDDSNTLGIPNGKSFQGHRHDQSVLSLLSKKWGFPAYRDPSQYGQFGASNNYYAPGPYEQTFIHDRLKL